VRAAKNDPGAAFIGKCDGIFDRVEPLGLGGRLKGTMSTV
jgi:hypothetical protein